MIFVLDIGTRSVVGIAGHMEGEIFVVEAWDVEPHPRRAMIDGQIEDIEQVAKIAAMVKGRMEEKLGVTFQRVSVAAAGRALKTCRASAKLDLPEGLPINGQTAYQLEMAAINEARAQLDTEDSELPYYCAGHSVVRYLLDGYPFTTIIDHRAHVAEVEIIATFLPAEVVESLRHCMALLDLDIDTLTLEPIAAMRAVIPQDLRLLNLALIDIGAGTSDIALSANGSVSGYTMATVAGDEVTEAIIKKYLVDFATAEKLKLAFAGNAPTAYTDILGFEHELDLDDVRETIAPAVDTLAGVIAEKILETNEGPPAAAFLVGGGSKTPGLCEKLTEKLSLGTNKAALAGTNFSGRILNEDSGLDGPEYATPVGIALVAADNASTEGASVTINGKRVRLFTPTSSSVMDALLIAGYQYSDLMGRNGRSLTFTLNGVKTILRGEPYTAAELAVNGRPASLSTPVEDGDVVDVTPATSGQDAFANIEKYSQGYLPITVSLNGSYLLAGLIARINGTVAKPDTPIFEQDDVEVFIVRTVGDLCDAAEMELAGAKITVNGVKTGPEHEMNDGDTIVVEAGREAVANEEPAPTPAPQNAPAEPAPAIEEMPAVAEPELPPEDAAPASAGTTPEAPATAEAAPEKPEPAEPAPAPPKPTAEMLKPQPAEPEPAPAASPAAPAAMAAATEAPAAPAAEEAHIVQAAVAPAAPAPQAAPQPPAKLAPKPVEPAPKPAKPIPVRPAKAEPAAAAPDDAPASAGSAASTPPADAPAAPPRRSSLRIELNGKTVVLPPKPNGDPHQLFDMMALVDIDPANPKGMVKVLLNGAEASYLEELVNGDKVDIGWDETRPGG